MVNNYSWIYDLPMNTWIQLHPSTVPSARYNHVMVYDTTSSKVTLFEGRCTSFYSDTWVYDLQTNTCIQMSPSALFQGRCFHSMVFDSFTERVVMFGGSNASTLFNGSWVYQCCNSRKCDR